MNERSRNHQPAFHAAGEAARDIFAPVPEAQRPQVLLCALPGQLARETVIARLVQDDVLDLLPEVQVDLLRDEADAGLGGFELGVDVVAENLDVAAGLVHE